jgi:pyruvate dehydrogenase E1 component
MVPFFIFYSMFGFQRVGDLIWAMADARGRGFLCGATAGRTTLMGEGLQHQDGHSLLLASTVPPCQAYDAAFAYELGAIVESGLTRMYVDGEDVFYYLTLYNENYTMMPRPEHVDRADIVRGLYRFAAAPEGPDIKATVVFSGTAQGPAREAASELADRYDVGVELWSATSYKALRDEALSVERRNRLHPDEPGELPYVTRALADAPGPVVAVTDFMRAVPDQIARWVPRRWFSLGTDGFGRSDTREQLRTHFEIDAPSIIVAVLSQLAAEGAVGKDTVEDAIRHHGVATDQPDPWSTTAH